MKLLPFIKMVDFSILILSCDKYSPLWQPFFYRFKKYWPNSYKKVYLLSNFLNTNIEGVENIKIGEDKDWSSNLLKGINLIDSEYIFILLDDVFLKKKIDKFYLESLITFIERFKPNYLNTKSEPIPKGEKVSEYTWEIIKGSHYRCSISNSFWNKKMLINLLVEGESPWEFERNGSKRSNFYNGFYGTKKSLLDFHHVIIGGKLSRDVLHLEDLKSKSILESFPPMSKFKWIIFKLTIIRSFLFTKLIPHKYQQQIRNIF